MSYVVIDDAFPSGLITAANVEWPGPTWPHWHVYADRTARKLATKDEARVTPACRLLLHKMAELQSDLLPADAFPDLMLHGAGMHELPAGGHLARHLDSDSHPTQPEWRRVASGVLLLGDEFGGGEFCLEVDGKVEQIPAKRNRFVMFLSSDTSWHWVNAVSGCPRRTLAMFWWRVAAGPSRRDRAHFEDAT